MPKRSASLKPSSKPFSRRGHSHSAGKCNAHHVSLSSPSSPLSSGSSLSLSPSLSSLPESTSSSSSSSCSPTPSSSAISSTPQTSSFASSLSLPHVSPPASSISLSSSVFTPSSVPSSTSVSCCSVASSPSSSSRSESPSSLASFAVTCSEAATSEPSSCVSYCQAGQNDVLSEYLKGLQEANKALDADVAERVLQELAESLSSPSAAALVVSSGGARFIASSVKQFKSHGSQKISKGSGRGSRLGCCRASSVSKTPESDGIAVLSEVETSQLETVHSDATHETAEAPTQEGQPSPGAAPNEARRKRQRTSGELDEEEDCKDDFSGESKKENYGPSLFVADNQSAGKTCERATDANVLIPCEDATGSRRGISRCTGQVNGEDISFCKAGSSPILILEQAAKVKEDYHKVGENGWCTKEDVKLSNGWIQGEETGACHTSYNHLVMDELLTNISNFGHVNGVTLCADASIIDEVSEPGFATGVHESASASGLQAVPLKSASRCVIPLAKRRESARLQKQSANGSSITGKVMARSGSCLSNGVAAGGDQEQVVTSVGRVAPESVASCRNDCETCDACHRCEHDISCRSEEEVNTSVDGKKFKDKRENSLVRGSDRPLKDIFPGEEGNEPRNKSSLAKGAGERVLREEGKSELPNVLILAKEAGLPDVVAAACHALDKLINAALQGKASSVGTKSASLPVLSGGRRGKALSAEMYVALTEALVEIVQVLKDHVELLCWCLDCLGSILPPTSNDRSSCDGSLSTGCTGLGPFFSSKDLLHAAGCRGGKSEGMGVPGKQHTSQQSTLPNSSQSTKECSSLVDNEVSSSKTMPKSFSGAVSSGTPKNGSGNTCSGSGKNSSGLGSSLCSSMSSDSAASSISALAAVAYTATVPMLAEKAVKAVLSAMQPCDIEAHSTQAALHALSAHLSSTNSKYVCDDAITFIIAAMREFKSDPEMQTESCMALCSLNRAVSSATGHNAWSAITDCMDNHRTSLMVQRAGCGALQVLCTRAGLGVPEWGSGKRSLRASKDADREAGVRALICAMLSFPEDVRIQWHGCSTLWTLVHSAGARSVANMVRNGAVSAVVGAMLVCRMNEMMQQEGCNVLGTMARTLAENGYEFGPLLATDLERDLLGTTGTKSFDRHLENGQRLGKTTTRGDTDGKEGCSTNSPDDWWEALKVVVAAMRAFHKSKSVQSNGTFALGCILKGSVETIHLGLASPGISPMPGLPLSNTKPSKGESIVSSCGNDTQIGNKTQKGVLQPASADSCFERAGVKQAGTLACLGKDLIDDVERLNAAVEVTMTAMREFPKVETVQVWGCAVLQQAFLAYVHYSKRMSPLSTVREAGGMAIGSVVNSGCPEEVSHCKGLVDVKSSMQVAAGTPAPSAASALANLVLSQATSAMCMISGTMALSYSGTAGNGAQPAQNKVAPNLLSKSMSKLTTSKSSGVKSQNSTSNQSFASVRQSWCAALGAIGDVFGHLTRNTEVSIGKSLPSMADSLNLASNSGSADHSGDGVLLSDGRSSWLIGKVAGDHKEVEVGCIEDDEGGVILGAVTPGRRHKSSHGLNETKCTSDAKPYNGNHKNAEGSKDTRRDLHRDVDIGCEKKILSSCPGLESKERGLMRKDWGGVDTVSQQQAVKDIKAWQEATESLAKIAERVGFPMSVKNAILAIRTVLYKLEDAETVIWACHALISLYLTWENVHLFKPGVESDREDYKSKIWGEGDVGVRQLVDLVTHWTGQNRPDVTSLALQALYSACVFAATVREIEEVFAPGGCGTESVLGAMQKALGSAGSLSQRRKVVQQSCCVLTTVCGYSIRAQVAFAAAGGADIILAALDRYDEDSQILVNGLHALGLDSRLQPDFDALWNAAIYRNTPSSGSKGSRRKRGGSSSGSVVVGLMHIFKEGAGLFCNTNNNSMDCKGAVDDTSRCEASDKSRWTPQLERLVFDGTAQMGLFRTWLIAGPGCGGPPFATEVLRRLNSESQNQSSAAEMQAHVCLVIGYMSAHDSKWRQGFIDAGAIEAVLACMESVYGWRDENFTSFHVVSNGVEKVLHPEHFKDDAKATCSQGRPRRSASQNTKQEDRRSDFGLGNSLDAPVQCAACWALAGLVKDHKGSFATSLSFVIQALATALHRYGGLLHLDLLVARAEKVHPEVCAPARLALARLGVSRVGDHKGKHLVHEAAEAGDVTSLEALARKGVDLLALDDHGHSPLWYAEQSGQLKAVQYLKEQAQLYGRRKAREKAKAKSKQGAQKDESVTSGVQRLERELQVLQEADSQQILEGTEESSSGNAVQSASLPEILVSEADCSDHQVPADQDAKAGMEPLAFTGPLDSKYAADNDAASMDPCRDTQIHQSRATNLLVDEVASNNGLVQGKKSGKGEKKSRRKELKKRQESEISSLLEASTTSSLEEQSSVDFGVVTREEDIDGTNGQNLLDKADQDGLINERSEQVNEILREALVSGVVENLEAALQACEEPGCGADEALVKKVKAALSKRLKRMEKSSALQVELSAAMIEGKSIRLHAAILAVENVPRFAAAFEEKITAARHLLFEIERKERMMEKEEAHAASECGSVDEVPVVQIEDDGTGHDEVEEMMYNSVLGDGENVDIADRFEDEGETVQDPDPMPWTDVHVGRRHREKEAKEEVVSLDSRVPQSETVVHRSRSRRERGSRGRQKGGSVRKHPSYASRGSAPHLGHGSVRILRSKGSCSTASLSPPFDLLSLGPQEMPPLLPTPPHTEAVPLSAGQISRSVIQPPRQKDQSTSPPLEHNPITPQLFPVSRGPPLGYSCHGEVAEGRLEGDIAVSSAACESFISGSPSESGLLHISQLFPPSWASPQLFTYRDCVRHDPWPPDSLEEHGTSTSGSLASLLATILPSHLTGAPVSSSSTTLFSTPFEKLSFPFSSCGTAFSASAAQTLLPTPLPTLNVHARPFLPTSEPIVGTLPPFVQQALSCTCDDDGSQESPSSPLLNSSSPRFFSGDLHEASQNTHSKLGIFSTKTRVVGEGCDPRTGLNCLTLHDLQHLSQAQLQHAALMDASMEDSCCICFDRPKDAALISCGHRMCKGCAEEMHRIRHLCPVCNRFIEAVLALYG